ncbi:MAG TPA: hypothetical protein VGF69_12990 [Thermoanaerobaculia bacterium]|jgi:hypothetical protein
MLKVFRLLNQSLKQFALGFGPAILMAFVCLAIQIVVPQVAGFVLQAISPPEPPRGPLDFIRNAEAPDARDQARDLFGYTLMVSTMFFFHALVALILTAWLLRRRAGFARGKVLRRALRGAGLLTCAAALVFAAAFALSDLLPATRDVRVDFRAFAMLALWFGATALLLPARLMGYAPATAPGFLQTTLITTVVLVPWFFVSEIVGAPLRHCRDCGNLFEGGLLFWLMLGGYLLSLTVSSAAISTAACLPAETQPVPSPAA